VPQLTGEGGGGAGCWSGGGSALCGSAGCVTMVGRVALVLFKEDSVDTSAARNDHDWSERMVGNRTVWRSSRANMDDGEDQGLEGYSGLSARWTAEPPG